MVLEVGWDGDGGGADGVGGPAGLKAAEVVGEGF